jgi:replication initiation and membrane attachment protein DnaB
MRWFLFLATILFFLGSSFSLNFIQRILLKGIIYQRKVTPQVNITVAGLVAKYNTLNEEDRFLLETLLNILLE